MASRSILNHRGFTLIEVVIVIGLIVIIAAFTLVVSLDDYRGYGFRNERDVVVAVLQKARSQAINNMCFGDSCTDGVPHGVYFGTPGKYVIFQGAGYNPTDEWNEVIVAENNAVSVSGMDRVTFDRLSGDATIFPPASTLVFTDERGKESIFTIEDNGRISWTN
jgi:prepilin-type N-terminal cleavage/methylation domain-containing protein